MIQVIIKRKNLEKVIDISDYSKLDLEKLIKTYTENKEYIISFKRIA